MFQATTMTKPEEKCSKCKSEIEIGVLVLVDYKFGRDPKYMHRDCRHIVVK